MLQLTAKAAGMSLALSDGLALSQMACAVTLAAAQMMLRIVGVSTADVSYVEW